MNKLSYVVLASLLTLLTSCETEKVERGIIVSNDFTASQELADGRFLMAEMYVPALLNEHNDKLFRIRKGIQSDQKFTDSRKQALIDSLKDFEYEPMRYLVLGIRFKGSKILSDDNFTFDFKDRSGNTIIERTLRYNYKAEYGTNGSIWIVKLKKPFTAKDYAAGRYPFTVTFPGGKKIVWEIASK